MPRRAHRFIAALILVPLGAFAASLSNAQEAPRDNPPPADAVRRVFVPLEDLQVVIDRDKKGVLLPRDEFARLYEKARAAQADQPRMPRGIVLSKATYEAAAADGQLRLEATLELVQFADRWHRLPLPFAGLSVEAATLDNAPARLGRLNGDLKTLYLLNEKSGNHTLKLTLSAPLRAVASDEVAAFQLAEAPSGSLRLRVPAAKQVVFDGRSVEPTERNDSEAIYDLAVGGRSEIQLRITEGRTQEPSDRLLFATTGFGANVAPGEVTWIASTTVNVFGPAIDRIVAEVPNTLEVTAVESSGLESWNLADSEHDPNRTAVTLAYRQPFTGVRAIVIRGVMSTTAGEAWTLPNLVLNGVTSHVGRVVVKHPSTVRLRTVESEGARSTTAEKDKRTIDVLPVSLETSTETALYYDAWQEGFSLAFVTEPKEGEVAADVLTSLEFDSGKIDVNTAATFRTVYAPLYQIDAQLPAEWTVTGATINGNAVDWQEEAGQAGVRHIRVELQPPLEPGNSARLILTARRHFETWPLLAAGTEIELAEVRFPQAAIVEGAYVVKAADELEIAPVEIRGLDPAFLNLPDERLGYRYQDTRFAGVLLVKPRAARIAAQTLTFARLDPDALRAHVEATVTVEGGKITELELGLPEGTGENLRFLLLDGDARIAEQHSARVVRGERIWKLRFDQPVNGRLVIATDLETERLESEIMPVLTVPGAERQNGHIAIEAGADQRLQLETEGVGGLPLSEVDPVDLPSPLDYKPRERIIAAIRYVAPNYEVRLAEQRFEREAVPTAICHRGEIQTVLARSGERQHRAWYELTTVGVQSLQFELPAEAELWAALIDGKAVEVRQTNGTYLAALGSAERADSRRTLELFFATESPPLGNGGTLAQRPPKLSVVSGAGQAEPLEIVRQSWRVYYPRELAIVKCDGPFEPKHPLEETSALGRFQQGFAVGSPVHLLWQAFYVLLAAGLIALFGVAVARRGWWGAVGAAGIVAVLVAIWVAVPASYKAREAAQRTAPVAEVPPPGANAPFADFDSGKRLEFFGKAVEKSAPSSGPAPQAGRGMKGPAATARLSIPLTFAALANSQTLDLEYLGSDANADTDAFRAVYADEGAADRLAMVLAVALAAGFWLIRRRSVRVRAGAAVFAMTLPLALVTITPATWHPILDGLFFGGLTGVGLWALRAIVSALAAVRRPGWQGAAATAARGVVLILAVTTLNAWAAEDTTPVAASAPAASNEGSDEAGAVDGSSQPAPTVIVPYETGTDPLAADRVYLPHDEFLDLWNRANPDKKIVPPAPVEGLVAGAVYSARLEQPMGGEARIAITGRIVLHSFRDYPIRLPLPFRNVAVRSAQLDGAAAALKTGGSTDERKSDDASDQTAKAEAMAELEVVVPTGGPHVLDVEFDVPVDLTGPAGRFGLRLAAIPSGRLTFALPNTETIVRVNDSTENIRRRSEGEQEFVEIPIDAGGDVVVAWRPQTVQAAAEATIQSDATTAVTIDNSGVHWTSRLRFNVMRGALSEMAFTVPAALKVQSVGGPDVAAWKFEGGEGARLVRVFLRRGVDDATDIEFRLYLPAEIDEQAATLTLPQVMPHGVTQDAGHVAVFADAQFAVRVSEAKNLTQINAGEFPKPDSGEGPEREARVAFRYIGGPAELALAVARRRPEIVASAEHGVRVDVRKQLLTSRFTLDIQDAPRGRIVIVLPDEFLTLGVESTYLADWYESEGDGGRRLIMDFGAPRTGKIDVALRGSVAKEPEDESAYLELPHPLEVDKLTSQLAVWVDDLFVSAVEESAGWKSVDPAALPEALRSLSPQGAQFGFSSTVVEPPAVEISLARVAARLRGNGVTVVTVSDTSVDYTLALEWDIVQGAADTFVFTTPDRLAGKLDFRAPGLRQVSQMPMEGGRTRWVVTTQEPQRGRYFLTATATFPPPAEDRVVAPVAGFEEAGDAGAAQSLAAERQYVILVNRSSAELTPVDADVLEPMNAHDLPIEIGAELVESAAVVARVKSGLQDPAWRMKRFAADRGSPASVNLADLTTLVARDGTWRTQGVYRIKNRSRQFLALVLPDGSDLLSVFVKGRPARAAVTERNGKKLHLIALPKGSEADLSFEVRVIVSGRLPQGTLPRGFRPWGREFDLPAPTVVPLRDDAEFGIPVARTRWTTWFPTDVDLRAIDDPHRNNLSLAPREDVIEQMALLDEVAQLLNVLEGSGYSSRTKYRALANGKQLSEALRVYANQTVVTRGDARRVQELSGRMLGRLEESKLRLQVDETKNGAWVDADGNAVDEPQLRKEIDAQNRLLYEGNAAWVQERPGLAPEQDWNLGIQNFSLVPPSAVPSRDSLQLKTLPTIRRGLSQEETQKLNEGLMEQSRQIELKERAGMEAEQRPAVTEDEAGSPRQREEIPLGREGVVFQGGGDAVEGEADAGWSAAGGLSVEFGIPQEGQKLVFTKVGGEPKLALRATPRRAVEAGLDWAWTAVWLALGVGAFVTVNRSGSVAAVGRLVPAAATVLGLLGSFLLAAPAAWAAFGLFVLGAVVLVIQRQSGARSQM